MNPWPLIPFSLVAASAVAFVFASIYGVTLFRGVRVGVRSAALCGFVFPFVATALVFGWSSAPFLGGIMALITALLGIPCGAAVGLLAAGARQLVKRTLASECLETPPPE